MNATKILLIQAAAGAGDVTGPASATDNAICRFDGTGGKTIQNSAVTIADTTGAMTWAALQDAILTAGSSGASLTLEQGASGGALITPGGVAGFFGVTKAMPSTTQFTATRAVQIINTDTTANNWAALDFVDSAGGATVVGVYAKYTDHTNNYGEIHLATRGSGGLASRLTVSELGVVSVTATTASTSTTTGSLINAGGFGCAGAAYIGGLMNVAGTITSNSTSGIIASAAGAALVTAQSSVNGSLAEFRAIGKNSTGTARSAYMGINKFADDVWSLYDGGSTELLRVGLTTGNLTASGTGTHTFGTTNTVTMAAGVISAVGAGCTIASGTAIPAGGTAGTGYKFSSTSNFGVFFGSGAPTLAAAKGSLYLRSDGSGTGDRAYINTNGSTTWTALTTAA